MKKNTFSITNDDNLLSNIESLLKFIKKSHASATFLGNSPRRILKAKLDELEFKSNSFSKNECFIIKFKDKNKITDILFAKQLLVPLESSITDKKWFIEEVKQAKFLDPELKLKTLLKNILTKLNKKNIIINIHETINFLQETHLSNRSEKRNKVEINFLFNYLKISLLSMASSNKFYGSAESLLASAENLTRDCFFDLSAIISSLNNITSLKNIAQIVFSYKKLLHKVASVFLTCEQSRIEIQSIIDATIEDNLANESIKSNFIFFKKSYFSQPGFRSILADNDLYNLIQTACEKLNFFAKEHIKITGLIEELSIYSDKIPEIIDLSTELNHLTNQYFQDLFIISISKIENKNCRKKNIFEDFQSRVRLAINNFREKNILSLDQTSILHKILNAIAKLIPKFILSTKTRITFFQKQTPQSKQLSKIESAFFSIKCYL